VIQSCSSESLWMTDSMDNNKLAQPLTVQCAHNVQGYELPPVAERYQSQQQTTTPVQEVQSTTVKEVKEEIVDENTEVVILGTTLIPVVKERVVQNVIKEVHNYPIQRKRIIKTKHVAKPTEFEREFVERIPATKIVPTVEERLATEVIHGTTLIPMVEEAEVTEMLPKLDEVQVIEEEPKIVKDYEVEPTAVVVEEQPAIVEDKPVESNEYKA
jgi:hypothetical protein